MNTDKTVVVVAAALQVLSTAAGMLFLQSCEETTKRDLHVIIIYTTISTYYARDHCSTFSGRMGQQLATDASGNSLIKQFNKR